MTKKKKTLCIQWTSRTFLELLGPLLLPLSKKFTIVVLLLEYSTPENMRAELEKFKKQGQLAAYFITPNHKKKWQVLWFMKRITKQLQSYDFDVWLSTSEMQVIERYMREIVLPKKCISVLFWHHMTYLLMYQQALVKKILSEIAGESATPQLKPSQNLVGLKTRLVDKLKQAGSRQAVLKKGITFLPRRGQLYYRKLKNHGSMFLERIIYPWILTGKSFRFGSKDRVTQLGSGRSDVMVFTDEMEAKVHRHFLKHPSVYVAQYLMHGNCRCEKEDKHQNIILSALSGFEHQNRLTDKILALFYRDFRLVLDKTGAEAIHLRPHPDETGKWPQQLKDYLVKRGIQASLVSNQQLIREVICDYLGMAGYASASLRVGRASCDYAVIIGFVGISKPLFKDPKFIFGQSEGIGWIEEDGSYDPAIFVRRRYHSPPRQNIIELLETVTQDARLREKGAQHVS